VVPLRNMGAALRWRSTIDQSEPLALSLSKGFDKLSPNGNGDFTLPPP